MGYIKCINWSLNAITICWRQHLMSTSLVQLNWKVLNLSVSLLITTSEPQNTRLDLIFCYLLVPLLYKWMLHLNFELIVLLQLLFRLSIWLFCLLHLWGCLWIHLFIPIQGCHYEAGAGDLPRLLRTRPPATFIGKWKKNRTKRNSQLVWFPAYLLYLPGNLKS